MRLHKFVTSQAKDSDQRRQLQNYFDEKDNDIIVIAFAIRHAFAHGDFTPAGAGITKNSKKYFLEIADSVIKYADHLFDKSVRSILSYR